MASISRFGLTISSGNAASARSLASRALVSSAVWSSRFAKSGTAVTVINKAPDQFGRTILHGTGFVNLAWKIAGALKLLEKVRKNHGDVTRSRFITRLRLQ